MSAARAADGESANNLDVSEVWTYTGSYTVPQAALDGNGVGTNGLPDGDGDIDNTVTVDFAETDPQTASKAVPIVAGLSYVMAKTVTDVGGQGPGGVVDAVGDVIQYAITVQNTGTLTTNHT